MKKLLFLLTFLIFLSATFLAFAASPKIFFSDLTDGPTSGWEQSATKGAAVTIWGRNFGASRGTSTLTVGGITLSTDADFAEWGATTTPETAQGLQRITFYLNSSMSTSGIYPNTTIQVTVGGVASNTLKFHCRALGTNHIYFVAKSDGSDSYNGFYCTRTGHSGSDGPKVTAVWAKLNLLAGDVVYFRTGQWATIDSDNAIMSFGEPYGAGHHDGVEGYSVTMASYPGEMATIGDAIGHMNTGNKYAISTRWNPTVLRYWTFSKLRLEAWGACFEMGTETENGSSNLRIVGNDIQSCYTADLEYGAGCGLEIQGGGVGTTYFYLLGNFIHDIGTDGYKGSDTRTMYRRIYCFYIGGWGPLNHIYVGYNEMGWNPNGRGFQVFGHKTTDTVDNLYIFNNFTHDMSRQGCVLGGGDANDVEVAYTFMKTCYLYNNIFDVPGTGDYTVQLNDFDTWGNKGGTFHVYNNFIRQWAGNEYRCLFSNHATLYMKNNILITNSTANVYTTEWSPVSMVGSNNLYYGLVGSHRPSWDLSTLDPADPKLVINPPSTSDYTTYFIQSSSPAKDAGADLSTAILPEQVAGLNRPGTDTDFLGVTRSAPFDIGAFEYASTAPDTTPPAAVVDLGATNATSTTVVLGWTAPGNDENIGKAASYDIRYGTSLITDANWSSRIKVSSEPSPSFAGTIEIFIISGLTANTTYYFALKTQDYAGNISGISNIASATTALASPTPDIASATATLVSDEGSKGGGSGGGGCFIATATFGTPMAKEVAILIMFKDRYLLNNKLGYNLVRFYYKVSPPIARYIKRREWARNAVRILLQPVVWVAKKTVEK